MVLLQKPRCENSLNIICTGGPNLHIRIDGLDRNDRKR